MDAANLIDILSIEDEPARAGSKDIPNAIYSTRDEIDWDKVERENRYYERKRQQ